MPSEIIANKIYIFRGHRVMIDSDLAQLYDVEIKNLTRQVRRNIDRFPEDFMFQLTSGEFDSLRCHFVTLKKNRGQHRKYLPYVFTEQGVAMLSSVLRSKRAVQVNIQIMRTFTKIRELLATNEVLRKKIEAMESKYDQKFKVVFDVIKKLISEDKKPKTQIGFEIRKKK
ncbi:ORF6N domain-containing protein [Patescibacteria group bacterium]|nr:ORF6N domain-containing protein [Patescibacteria group bacterium]